MNFKKSISVASERSDRIVQWVDQHCVTRWLADHGNLAFFYGIFLFLYEVSILREVVPAIHPPLIAWAGLLAVYDIFVRKLWKDTPFWNALLLFMISAAVTAVINMETGVVSNVKAWIMTIIPLVAFYPVCVTGNLLEKKRTLVKAMMGGAIVVFLCSLVAIGMYLARISETVEYMGKSITIGFRYYIKDDPSSGILLFGLNEDTNHSAAYALVFAAYSIFLILNCRKGLFSKKWMNTGATVFAAVNLAVQIGYFPLANSRGGWLSLIVSGAVALFLFFYRTKFAGKKGWQGTIVSIGATVCMVIMIYVGLVGIRTAISRTSTMLHTPGVVEKNEGTYTTEVTETTETVETTQTGATEVMGATQPATEIVETTEPVIYEEIFNKADTFQGGGRIWIWTDVLSLFVKKPILGNGPGNNAYYAEKFGVAPYSMGYGKAVHNSYLDLLLNYGVIGFVLTLAFWVLCVKAVLVKVWTKGRTLDLSYYLVAFSVLLVAITSVFLSSVFINTTAVSHIMFIMVGYLVTYAADESAQ